MVGAVPQRDGAHVTLLAAMSLRGVEAVMTMDGATDAEVVSRLWSAVVGPTLVPGDIVIMDNLRAHTSGWDPRAHRSHGAQLIYLPPYSPDLSPIEPCWSKPKTLLRTAPARTRDALDAAIEHAGVSPDDIHVYLLFEPKTLPLPLLPQAALCVWRQLGRASHRSCSRLSNGLRSGFQICQLVHRVMAYRVSSLRDRPGQRFAREKALHLIPESLRGQVYPSGAAVKGPGRCRSHTRSNRKCQPAPSPENSSRL